MRPLRNIARDFAPSLALAVVYFLAAKVGLEISAVSGFASLVWAPSGIGLAAVSLLGYRGAIGVLLGAFAVNVWAGAPVPSAVLIGIGNTLEAIVGTFALRRLGQFHGSFDRLRHVFVLLGPVAFLSTAVSASVGVLSLTLAGKVPVARFTETWNAWWIGDMLGDLVVAPLLLTWAARRDPVPSRARLLEAFALFSVLVAITINIFFRPAVPAQHPLESTYALFPVFVWAAVRFEFHGATLATVIASAIALWGTIRGLGPFARASMNGRLFLLQTFTGSAAFTPLVVAGAISDRARALRIRENFMAIVSHDLKSPLSILRMGSESLAKKAPDDAFGERVRKNDERVQRSIDRMTRLIGDLLDASAIEVGRFSIQRRDEELSLVAREALDALQPMSAAKHQTTRIEASEPVRALCDRERILQVLVNLLGNAIKFTGEGGSIVVALERRGTEARIAVRDTGIGIEPRQREQVFQRYWRARTTSDHGSGLGLFIVKGIVEAHAGRVWVESELGVGTTFTVALHGVPDGSQKKGSP